MSVVSLAFRMAATVTDGEAIAAMAASTDPLSRLGAAANEQCPQAVLMALAHDTMPCVRLQALLHRQCPPATVDAARADLDALLDEVLALMPAAAAGDDVRRSLANAVDVVLRR